MVQKKTFCKWVNSHLVRANCRISDLNMDLRDGKMLIKLLEILSGEKLVRRSNMLRGCPVPSKFMLRVPCSKSPLRAR